MNHKLYVSQLVQNNIYIDYIVLVKSIRRLRVVRSLKYCNLVIATMIYWLQRG